jgi:hypothetical protein
MQQHEAWKMVVAVHQMVHPSENPSTFLWFLVRSPRHVGGHDIQQHDTPSAAGGASVVAGQTLQQIILLAAAAVVGAVAVANELVAAVAAAATPCVAGSDDFHDLLMWPQGAAAALVPSPLQTDCSVLDGGLLLQLLQTSVVQHDFLLLLQIVAARQNDVCHAHVVPE